MDLSTFKVCQDTMFKSDLSHQCYKWKMWDWRLYNGYYINWTFDITTAGDVKTETKQNISLL